MAQANTHNTTTLASTAPGLARRDFIVGAALAVPAVAAAPIMAAMAASDDDPIFAAIEAHRAAHARVVDALQVETTLDHDLPLEKCRSQITVWDEKIVPTDDPRWIESEREKMRAWKAEDDAAFALLTVRPTTRAGTLSLLRYALAQDTDGEAWGQELVADDGRKRHWYYFLIDNVVAALDPAPQHPIL